MQATNNCVLAPEQRGPRTFFAQLLSKSTSDLTSQGTPAHSNRLSGRLVPNRLDNTSSEGTLGVLGTEKALLLFSFLSSFRAARLYEKNAHEDRVSRGGAQRLLTQFFIPDRARHPFAVNNARLSI